MKLIRRGPWKAFIKQTCDPQSTQLKFLRILLAQNKITRYGKEHCFSEVKNYDQFRSRVPINQFEELRPYIEQPETPTETGLTEERPALYMQTSGTTDQPKNIPLTRFAIEKLKQSQALFAYAHHLGIRDIFKGKLFTISGSSIEGKLDNGLPYGSMSGMISDCMPFLLKTKFLIPPAMARVADYPLKYLLFAAMGLKERDVTWLVSANPSTFLKLIEVMESHFEALIKLLDTGDMSGLPEGFGEFSARQFKASPNRVQELKTLSRKTGFGFSRIWPNLKAVTTWTGGSCGLLTPKLRNLLARETTITELGYIASEFRGSLIVDTTDNACVPAFNENFFEFIEPDRWDSGSKETRTLNQVEVGKQYYVIATTASGLYRYFINDIIEVTGHFNQTPTIRFIQKGKGITNLTGEKLTEFQVVKAMQSIMSQNLVDDCFFLLLGDAHPLQYRLFIEAPQDNALSARFDKAVSELNLEFSAKQESGRLHPTKVFFLAPGCGETYKQHFLARGQREAQFKTVRLQYLSDCDFDFQPYIISSA